ncbi:protein RER1A-like [Camellia sinensis]|uniref:Protein RER1 n=1 Tax=Camellia sinensis var. sinensis TaxID=542762 RepID=A0A4S4DXT9_CAMSN|nr:protein RER1A-like [Camellia sinensis]THG08239.1 hypothetical protein TEA_002216 [Camellia sinensis var. sinensis]
MSPALKRFRRYLVLFSGGGRVTVELRREPAVPILTRQVEPIRTQALDRVRCNRDHIRPPSVIFPGFYLVSYALGIYILNLLIGFLSPQVDPQFQDLSDGPSLPIRNSDEFRPFVRRLPEFKFWYSITRAFCIAFVMTFFSIFDVPVFWPILLFYFVMLFTLTVKRQILHMIKYRYVPFSVGKQRYDVKDEDSAESTSLLPRD